MKKSCFQKRMVSLRGKLSSILPDTLWIIKPENRRYLSGFKAGDPQLTESSGSLLINEANSLLITDSRYIIEARKESIDFDVVTIKNGLMEEFPYLLSRIGAIKLGFEEDYLTWDLHRQLTKKLKEKSLPVRMTPLKGLVDRMREVKDSYEIKTMAASAGLMSKILAEVIDDMKPGRTEAEIAWQIEGMAREAGAEDLAFPSIVASGPNSALPHAVPTKRKIRSGEPVILDVGVKLDGYSCDMTRTVFLGTAPPKFKKIYRIVRRAQLAALEKIRPGIESTVPDSAARELIADAGFGDCFRHALGHGVGMATHEDPRLGPRKPVILQEGMVVTVEPGIYIPGRGGVRLEEMVVIEKGGPRILTKDDHFYHF